jgi:hypothetical protein
VAAAVAPPTGVVTAATCALAVVMKSSSSRPSFRFRSVEDDGGCPIGVDTGQAPSLPSGRDESRPYSFGMIADL